MYEKFLNYCFARKNIGNKNVNYQDLHDDK